MNVEQFTLAYLGFFILPLWVAVGLADWACHRASRIEATAGTRESVLHIVMLAEAGIPLVVGLTTNINALILLVMAVFWLLHEGTSFWDLAYANARRQITPLEQRVHDYLSVIPLMALSFVIILHWPQALALVGLGPEPADFSLRWKDNPLPLAYSLSLIGAVVVFNGLPYLEELWRCLRYSTRGGGAAVMRTS